MDRVEAGRLGGLTTAARHGRGYMSEIGAKGFQATTDRHFGGDRAAARAVLARQQKLDGMRKRWLPTPGEWTHWLADREK